MNKYSSYKDSGVEWIGEIPISWDVGKLGFFSSTYRGSGYQFLQQVDEDSNETKERVVRIGDFSDFKPIWCKYLEQFENYRIKKGNLLIGGTGHYFGKTIFVSDEMEGLIHSYNIIRLVVNNQDSKYISYWLQSNLIREQMDISVLGSGQPFIDLQGVKDLKLLIPPLPEQQQIVSFLDDKTQKIDSLIQQKEKKIELLKEKRISLINHVVTKGIDTNVVMKDSGVEWIGEIPLHWYLNKVGHNTYVKGRIGWKGLRSEDFKDVGPYLITGTDFNKDGTINWNNMYHVEQWRYDEDPFIQLQDHDVLITKDGTIGKVVYVGNLKGQTCLNSGIFLTRPTNNEYKSRFFFWLLNSNVFKVFVDYNSGGSTIQHLYQNVFVNFKFPIPPISEQQQIVEYLDKNTEEIDTLIQLEQKKIDTLKEYRQSLISEVVTGKIKVCEEDNNSINKNTLTVNLPYQILNPKYEKREFKTLSGETITTQTGEEYLKPKKELIDFLNKELSNLVTTKNQKDSIERFFKESFFRLRYSIPFKGSYEHKSWNILKGKDGSILSNYYFTSGLMEDMEPNWERFIFRLNGKIDNFTGHIYENDFIEKFKIYK